MKARIMRIYGAQEKKEKRLAATGENARKKQKEKIIPKSLEQTQSVEKKSQSDTVINDNNNDNENNHQCPSDSMYPEAVVTKNKQRSCTPAQRERNLAYAREYARKKREEKKRQRLEHNQRFGLDKKSRKIQSKSVAVVNDNEFPINIGKLLEMTITKAKTKQNENSQLLLSKVDSIEKRLMDRIVGIEKQLATYTRHIDSLNESLIEHQQQQLKSSTSKNRS